MVHSIQSFLTFLYRHLKYRCYCYTSYEMTDHFNDFSFKWTATARIGIHPTKSWLPQLVNFKNAIWHLRGTICNKILFQTWKKISQKRMECFRLLLEHFAWIELQFWVVWEIQGRQGVCEGGWDVWESIDQSWLVKGLGLGLLCWGFKGVQQEIPREEASTLQIGSVVFPPGQCNQSTTPSLSQIFDQDGHQDSSSPSL